MNRRNGLFVVSLSVKLAHAHAAESLLGNFETLSQ